MMVLPVKRKIEGNSINFVEMLEYGMCFVFMEF